MSTVGKFLKVVSFLHQHSGNLSLNAKLCAMQTVLVSRVDWWRNFPSTCEERQQVVQVDPWEPHCRELCLGDETVIEASIDWNWLSAGV